MRNAMIAAVAIIVAMVSPASAQISKTDQAKWMACYDLGWSRGVHLELWEMPGWIDECLAGRIPFPEKKVAQKHH